MPTSENTQPDAPLPPSRREMLRSLACGVGGIGLAAVLAQEAAAGQEDPAPQGPAPQGPAPQGPVPAGRAPGAPGPHHAAKARSLIFLNMMGGPTQFETFDYKPEMAKWAGKTAGAISKDGMVRANPEAKVLPPLFRYVRKGEAGLATTEVFPHMAEVLDELCVIRTMVADSPAHPAGQKQAMTGFARQAMPSFGSWILYGLGSANRNLPGFVHLAEGNHHGSGFLPATTQGMPIGHRIPNLKVPAGLVGGQRGQLDLLADLNRGFAERNPGEDVLAARIEAAELAFRMQTACPEAVDIAKESPATLALYGIDGGKPGRAKAVARSLTYSRADLATMCLVARRLVERGVRVITICVGGRRGWDQHKDLKEAVAHNAGIIDQPIAALLRDLRGRGLLDSTLVMWGGEFGRTPYAQNDNGRDHFAKGFTYWLAGGGSRRGTMYGLTDDIGQNIVQDPVHIHDLHATVLHLMGLDPDRLTFRYAGRDQRLTDVSGRVIPGLLA